ncbi:aldehyde dehydrogenase family protein [Paraburkholderia strydomiana]|uniref:aldehyde dehydrogenase family protein n=1 Tax=Paraburkholderia strydomiana TaxID=1245417 RepID=UPI0038BD8AFF
MASHLKSVFDTQKEHFLTDVTKSYVWRIDQLDRLERLLVENQQAITEALGQDFKTAWFEQSMEFYGTLGAIAHAKQELKEWMAPQAANLPKRFSESGHRAQVYREPYGVCLVIAPFNAPIILTLEPLIAALSAGNTVIVKPAETTVALSTLYEELFAKYFQPENVALVRGGRDVVTDLLSFPFDFIFFTGSTQVGKVIMRAAAENLTPVLLELGGQNPVLVDETANLDDAAEKIVWGATAFGGQWCVSPGYVYVHESVAEPFVEACKAAVFKQYGEDPKSSPDFSRIVTERDVDRLSAMLDGAPIIVGGTVSRDERYVAPTIVFPARWTDPVMKTEIFGPILPIMTYSELDEVINVVKRQPKSLAAYVFSRDEAVVNRLLQTLSFGGGAVNQTMVQCLLSSSLPFGGVGPSGLGRYYGKYGFDSLSHLKSVVFSPADVSVDVLLPPYTEEKRRELGEWFAEPEAR